MQFNANYYPFPSQRTVVYGRRGMVAASQPLAAQAGLSILQSGGNAVDAAVAAAAALPVVEPTSNGLGGDLFAIVYKDGHMHGLNSSGPAPAHLTPEFVHSQGHKEMPSHGWLPVTVPGIPGGWAALSERFGALSLSDCVEPAAQYAEQGHAVTPVVSHYWRAAVAAFRKMLQGPEFAPWFDTFAPNGEGPKPGDVWQCPDMADTLRGIGATKSRTIYEGEVAQKIAAFAAATGGVITESDLAAFEPEWVQPMSVDYRGYSVWELPPNGQGLVALLALGILDGIDYTDDSVQWTHQMIEAVKLAFADGKAWITDPHEMTINAQQLLTSSYLEQRRNQIGDRAIVCRPGTIDPGGTVYLAAADDQGTMVSLIQSNYMGFGSGIVVPGTGMGLQNRAHTFSLDPNHANYLRPGRRTYHTIIPGFLTKGDQPVGPFGVMGGFMQPQGHVQVLSRSLDQHLNPQAALDAPRFYWEEGCRLQVEQTMPEELVQGLKARGHDITVAQDSGMFGRGQIIWRLPQNVLAGGTESRADGMISVW